jgi:hypothetical protein
MLNHATFWEGRIKAAPANSPAGYLPLLGRNTVWTVFVNTNTAEVLAFVPLDPF